MRYPPSRSDMALLEARIRTNEWISAQKADRASAVKRRRFWGILASIGACAVMVGLGYLIGVEGKRAFGLAAFVGLSGLATVLVYGVFGLEDEE